MPMHPRKLLCPLRAETVFHVTNSGYSSSLSSGVATVAGDGCFERPKEKNEEFDEDFDLSPRAALDEVVESEEEGVEADEEPDTGEGACRRDMLGSCRPALLRELDLGCTNSFSAPLSPASVPPVLLSTSSPSSPSCRSAPSSSCFCTNWYLFHRTSAWWYSKGSRSSKSAARISKQYAQWAAVAIAEDSEGGDVVGCRICKQVLWGMWSSDHVPARLEG